MTVLTTLMLIAVLALAPLRISAAFRFDLSDKSLHVSVALFWVPVFREDFTLQGKYLVCKGSVDTYLDVFTMDKESGVNLAKALVVDSVNVTFAPDYSKMTPFAMLAVEAFCMLTTAVACASTNCRVRSDTRFSLENAIFGEVVVSVSLAEILLVLFKQKVRIWKSNRGRASQNA